MSSLELGLEVLINLEGITHLIINQKLVWDGERNQELSSVCLSLEFLKSRDDPEKDMLQGSLFTMNDISLEVRVKIRWIAQYFEETAHSLLSLVLCLLLNVNAHMADV